MFSSHCLGWVVLNAVHLSWTWFRCSLLRYPLVNAIALLANIKRTCLPAPPHQWFKIRLKPVKINAFPRDHFVPFEIKVRLIGQWCHGRKTPFLKTIKMTHLFLTSRLEHKTNTDSGHVCLSAHSRNIKSSLFSLHRIWFKFETWQVAGLQKIPPRQAFLTRVLFWAKLNPTTMYTVQSRSTFSHSVDIGSW